MNLGFTRENLHIWVVTRPRYFQKLWRHLRHGLSFSGSDWAFVNRCLSTLKWFPFGTHTATVVPNIIDIVLVPTSII